MLLTFAIPLCFLGSLLAVIYGGGWMVRQGPIGTGLLIAIGAGALYSLFYIISDE